MGFIRIDAKRVTVAAGARNAEIYVLQPPEGKKYNVLEFGIFADSSLETEVWFDNERKCTIDPLTMKRINKTILVNWEIQENHKMIIYATNPTTQAIDVDLIVVYEESQT